MRVPVRASVRRVIIVLLAMVSAIAVADPAAAGADSAGSQLGFALGAFVPPAASGQASSAAQDVQTLETSLGSRVAIASSFRGWGDLFPDASQLADSNSGHTLLVAWDLGATRATRFSTFPRHEHDRYLAQEAALAARYGKPLYIRPWAEMNGDWTSYQPTPNGDRPAGGTYAQFIAAWRYLVRFFRSHGATNVRWVFNPTTDTYAGTTPVRAIWPGRRYVDVLGLDGYNWGTGGMFTWRSFPAIFRTQYARLTALAPSLPVWVCETGSKEPQEDDGAPIDTAHSKAAWYHGMLRWVAGTRISALVFFDIDKERDWRVASDPAALTVLQAAASRALPGVSG